MLVLAFVAGLVGGVLSCSFFMGQPASAGKRVQSPSVIKAEEFRLVDQTGSSRAVLYMKSQEPTLELYSTEGVEETYLAPGLLSLQGKEDDGKKSVLLLTSIGYSHTMEKQGEMRLGLIGGPSIKLMDNTGNLRVLLAVTPRLGDRSTQRTIFELLNEKGKSMWQTP
jgi:hypothetical protein